MMKIETVKKYRECFAARYSYAGDDTKKVPEELENLFETKKYLRPHMLSFDVAKDLYIECAESICTGFKIDDNNIKAVDLIIQYLIRDEEFLQASKFNSFDKGILLRGSVGTGKTILCKALKLFLKHFDINDIERYSNYEYDVHLSASYNIAGQYSVKGLGIFDEYPVLLHRPIIIDDMGSEAQVSYFGNTANIIEEILYRRYEKKIITHGTTNLDTSALKEKYNARIYSRMKEMFNDVILTGNDRRK